MVLMFRTATGPRIRSSDQAVSFARLFADGGYAGQKLEAAVGTLRLTIEIIRRSDLTGFVVVRENAPWRGLFAVASPRTGNHPRTEAWGHLLHQA